MEPSLAFLSALKAPTVTCSLSEIQGDGSLVGGAYQCNCEYLASSPAVFNTCPLRSSGLDPCTILCLRPLML
ncbi:hypothetical protein EYF80_040825 [Liparis tanakae]|uniref:Uncharacterized protein n=1 Tax=Liparis tanakae TaxID=230148 RepID=A0A4Z2G604_9TELE|nr:hypothetical protein EYF80_040825 [Liparis tanakae]